MDVVILAGGRCSDELRAATGAEFRADIKIGGRTLAERVLAAVKPFGEPILVGGPVGLSARRVESGMNFCESLGNGLAAVRTDRFLLVTVDLPALTTEGLRDFIEHCETEAGLNFPVVRIEDCEREFPGMSRTTLKLREGRVTGGNVGLMDTEAMRRTLPVMERAYALAREFADGPPLAVQLSKSMLLSGLGQGYLEHITSERYAGLANRLFGKRDLEEGARAFREKRKPRFQGPSSPDA